MATAYGKSREECELHSAVFTRFTATVEQGEVRPIHLSKGENKCYEHLYPGRYSYTGGQYRMDSLDVLPDNFDEAKELLVEAIQGEVEELQAKLSAMREKLRKAKKLKGPTKNGEPVDLSEANY